MRCIGLALLVSACTSGMHDTTTVEQQDGACLALEGRTFVSVNELECGASDDALRCQWSLSFAPMETDIDAAASEFVWAYSQVTEWGQVECRGQNLSATTSGGRTVTGTYSPETQTLSWLGESYVAAP